LGKGINRLLFFCSELQAELSVVQLVLHAIAEYLEVVLGLDALPEKVILLLKFLCIGDHAGDVLFREAAILIGERDSPLQASVLVEGGDV
jgi:hypothetical protein